MSTPLQPKHFSRSHVCDPWKPSLAPISTNVPGSPRAAARNRGSSEMSSFERLSCSTHRSAATVLMPE
eukprot:3025169-Prymnesium_polylepis.1